MVEIKTVGVIGAGQMGAGIAQVAALAGYDVVLTDVNLEHTQRALATINGHMARQISKGAITDADRKAALERIVPAGNLEAMSTCELVIEAAVENEAIKRQIFENLKSSLKPDAMVGSNTSSISITRLAAISGNPERFIGIHFMNPVPVMQLVELIRGIATNDETFEAAKEFCAKLGKTVTVSEDFPAFIVNRILLPMINEAIYTLYEGVGSSKYRPCPLLVKYVEAGWIGKKVKRGFYDYRGEKPVPTR